MQKKTNQKQRATYANIMELCYLKNEMEWESIHGIELPFGGHQIQGCLWRSLIISLRNGENMISWEIVKIWYHACINPGRQALLINVQLTS